MEGSTIAGERERERERERNISFFGDLEDYTKHKMTMLMMLVVSGAGSMWIMLGFQYNWCSGGSSLSGHRQTCEPQRATISGL
jgi:hypothetical protein